MLLGDAMDRGLNDAVKDNDAKFPPEWRLSKAEMPQKKHKDKKKKKKKS